MLKIAIRPSRSLLLLVALLLFAACTRTSNEPAPRASATAAKETSASDASATEAATNEGPATSTSIAKSATDDDAMKDNGVAEEQSKVVSKPPIQRVQPAPRPKLPPPQGAKPLSPDFDIWIDAKQGVVIVDGEICLREGMLEMFCCTRNTKEHEAIISANTRASLVHTGLLALGAEPGHPVEFMPEYKPPTGTEIEITIQWRDQNGKEQSARAQDLVKDIATGKPMTHPFVFAGSLFWQDPDSGKPYYMAENGDFICVSNFATAMLDIPVESSQSNDSLEFVALTERIPPLGTPVRMLLKPKLKKDADGARAADKIQTPAKADVIERENSNKD